MKNSRQTGVVLVALLACLSLTSRRAVGQTTAELDAFWATMARTVEEGDFDGYAALYHPDAVLVSVAAGTSYPIARALAGWKHFFVDTKSGAARASVQFRFSQRLHDDTTAHETGIFNYRFEGPDGQVSDQYTHFEILLVKKDGWKVLMEYQRTPATAEEWEALR